MAEASIKEQIRQFVRESAQGKGVADMTDDQSLMESGVIDSLGIFRMVSFLEDTFGVRVGDDEIIHDNFQSVNDIERFVNTKLASKAPAAR